MAKKVLLSSPQVRKRYAGRSRWTIRRWRKSPKVGFPEPDVTICGQDYWYEKTLDDFDAAQAAAARDAA